MARNSGQRNTGSSALSGLYVILDPSVCPERPLLDVLKASAEAGTRLFQYRNKVASMKAAYAEALPLRRVAHEWGALFIVNDRCDLALAVEADGVHLGQGDLPLQYARKVMGADKLIGISTHNPEQVLIATAGQPDYLGFGPIFIPGSKSDHDPVVGIEGLRVVRRLTPLPIIAIGGIGVETVEQVIQAGANGIAVISAILKAADVRQTVSDFVSRIAASISPTS